MPDISHKTPRWGDVFAVGPGVPDLNGTVWKPDVEVGDLAYVMAHGKQEVQLYALGDYENMHICSTLDILATYNMSTHTFQPLGSYIEIEELPAPETSKGGIIQTDKQRVPPNLARVKTLGKGWRTSDGHPIPFNCAVGDLIAFDPMRTMVVDMTPLGINEYKTIIMHGDIFAVITEE